MTEIEEAKKKRVSTAEKKRQEVRKAVWPELAERDLWLRSTSKGYTTIPRTLPLIVEIINCMTKGAPAGGVYFELWCRAFDEMFVDMDDAEGMAFAAGFSGPARCDHLAGPNPGAGKAEVHRRPEAWGPQLRAHQQPLSHPVRASPYEDTWPH